MPIPFNPRPGQILMCDFTQGFKEPEMVKKRPVVVLSPAMQGRQGLVTVAALSSVRPDPPRPFHVMLPKAALPQLGEFQVKETWVKGDMIYAVGFHRLNMIRLGKRDQRTGKRVYFTNRLGRERMQEIYSCVLHGLGIGQLGQYL